MTHIYDIFFGDHEDVHATFIVSIIATVIISFFTGVVLGKETLEYYWPENIWLIFNILYVIGLIINLVILTGYIRSEEIKSDADVIKPFLIWILVGYFGINTFNIICMIVVSIFITISYFINKINNKIDEIITKMIS